MASERHKLTFAAGTGPRPIIRDHETTSHTIDAEPKIPRGGTDLIMSFHGVEQAETRST